MEYPIVPYTAKPTLSRKQLMLKKLASMADTPWKKSLLTLFVTSNITATAAIPVAGGIGAAFELAAEDVALLCGSIWGGSEAVCFGSGLLLGKEVISVVKDTVKLVFGK
ncbi:hypothetical protein [Paraferrimonas haliotis]|uniref:Uncharacterized protein n=1 Tax=Paraferrimonas haliotis TaxID=2013866 RepID=A0AA37TRA2_9GAMM|nr:hypothetical protein [Paraferrimonas haliotis]GLS84188.1 hypothetical protein GCM10007894_21650 [Paraferrimonas haliotis]